MDNSGLTKEEAAALLCKIWPISRDCTTCHIKKENKLSYKKFNYEQCIKNWNTAGAKLKALIESPDTSDEEEETLP